MQTCPLRTLGSCGHTCEWHLGLDCGSGQSEQVWGGRRRSCSPGCGVRSGLPDRRWVLVQHEWTLGWAGWVTGRTAQSLCTCFLTCEVGQTFLSPAVSCLWALSDPTSLARPALTAGSTWGCLPPPRPTCSCAPSHGGAQAQPSMGFLPSQTGQTSAVPTTLHLRPYTPAEDTHASGPCPAHSTPDEQAETH